MTSYVRRQVFSAKLFTGPRGHTDAQWRDVFPSGSVTGPVPANRTLWKSGKFGHELSSCCCTRFAGSGACLLSKRSGLSIFFIFRFRWTVLCSDWSPVPSIQR
jgi:hypothetical protein